MACSVFSSLLSLPSSSISFVVPFSLLGRDLVNPIRDRGEVLGHHSSSSQVPFTPLRMHNHYYWVRTQASILPAVGAHNRFLNNFSHIDFIPFKIAYNSIASSC